MASGVVTVGHRQYVSGLYWENSPSGRVSQAAKEAARQPGALADFYAARSGNKQGRVPQYGLTQSGVGLKAGLPSLAGCLANQQPGSWIGAFRFREGTSVVIVRDDLVVPDGDLFFADESEARDRVYQEMGVGGFQRIYAPEAWGLPGADTMPVSLLLNDRADVKLHNVILSKQAKAAILLGGIVLLTVVGAGWYIQYRDSQEKEAQRQKVEAQRRLQEKLRRMVPLEQEPKYPEPDRVWEKKPRPMEIIDACHKALAEVSPSVAGWAITSMTCSQSGLDVKWARRGGFSNPPKGAIVSDTGIAAVSFTPINGLAPRGKEDLWDPVAITTRYLNQNWPGNMRRILDDPPPSPPKGYKGKWNPPPVPWVKRSFTFTVPVLPWNLADYLGDVPGVTIKSLSLSGNGAGAGNVWKIDGVIYENRR